jgi:hypothetical protein
MENECVVANETVAVIPPVEKPKRPSREDPEVLKSAAEKLAVKVEKWEDEEDGGQKSTDEAENATEHETLVKALIDAMRYGHDDGYELSEKLNTSLYINPDAQLVEILDDASHFKYNAYSVVLKKWVADNNIVCPFKLGDKVIYYKKEYRFQTGEPLDGEITSIHADTATCTVFVESEGHVKQGVGSHGYIVAYEDIGIKPEVV